MSDPTMNPPNSSSLVTNDPPTPGPNASSSEKQNMLRNWMIKVSNGAKYMPILNENQPFLYGQTISRLLVQWRLIQWIVMS